MTGPFAAASQPDRLRSISMGTTLAVGLALALYGLLLYFHAATASLYDDHQPGIQALRAALSPSVVLLLVLLVATVLPTRRAAQVAVLCCAGACVLALLMAAVTVGVHVHSRSTWVPPESRTLADTVYVALVHPAFSNRSNFSMVGSAVFAMACLSGALWLWRRRKLAKP